MSQNNISTIREKRKAVSRAVWGAVPPAVHEAQALGGKVVRVDDNGKSPVPAPARADDDCLALVRQVVTPERVAEASALDAMGERRQAREVREDIFVHALAAWLDCAGAVAVLEVVNGLAFLLRVSPQTVKRYLAAHGSVFGEFAIDGDFVRLRR